MKLPTLSLKTMRLVWFAGTLIFGAIFINTVLSEQYLKAVLALPLVVWYFLRLIGVIRFRDEDELLGPVPPEQIGVVTPVSRMFKCNSACGRPVSVFMGSDGKVYEAGYTLAYPDAPPKEHLHPSNSR